MVGAIGFEPTTPCSRSRCQPVIELYGRLLPASGLYWICCENPVVACCSVLFLEALTATISSTAMCVARCVEPHALRPRMEFLRDTRTVQIMAIKHQSRCRLDSVRMAGNISRRSTRQHLCIRADAVVQ